MRHINFKWNRLGLGHWLGWLGCLASVNASAQSVLFTNEFDSSGRVGRAANTWKIDPAKGSFIHLFYQSAAGLPLPKMYVFIDRANDKGVYEEYDTKKIAVAKFKTWSASRYLFSDEGTFTVSFTGPDRRILATDTIRTQFRTNLIFCENIDKLDKPIGINLRFKLTKMGQATIFTYLRRGSPFNCQVLVCEIYYYDGQGYNVKYFADRHSVKPHWKHTYFKHLFDKPGKYLVVVLDEQRKTIGREYLTVDLP